MTTDETLRELQQKYNALVVEHEDLKRKNRILRNMLATIQDLAKKAMNQQ